MHSLVTHECTSPRTSNILTIHEQWLPRIRMIPQYMYIYCLKILSFTLNTLSKQSQFLKVGLTFLHMLMSSSSDWLSNVSSGRVFIFAPKNLIAFSLTDSSSPNIWLKIPSNEPGQMQSKIWQDGCTCKLSNSWHFFFSVRHFKSINL